jgi:hypothetical protein
MLCEYSGRVRKFSLPVMQLAYCGKILQHDGGQRYSQEAQIDGPNGSCCELP